MTIIELKDQIVKNQLQNFYIFVGSEIGIINIYLEQMSNKFSLPITRADSVDSIYSSCMGGSLFGDSCGFYVIRDDKDFMKAEKVYSTISKDIGNNIIVLLYDKLDTRTKFSKYFKDSTVVFEKLTPTILKSYIRKEISLSDKNIDILMELCNGSYDMCMLEIDKIKHYDRTITPDGCFEELLECGVIYQPEESDVFEFTAAVCNRRINEAFYLEEVLRSYGVSSINILGTLYNSMKSILLIQCCEGNNISEVTGLDRGQIYYNRKYVNKYSTGDLVANVKLIGKVIDYIKVGKIDDIYATRYVLSFIL